ncbi:MAG: acyl-CoA carboxylase epsilon subunit [Nitriliruptorales bacterium]|nr:acyl-CoA carboxylase epsilon subunit [Nitriliruptorales bacterium]
MSTPRYEIVSGGQPSAEELAAIVVALTPVAVDMDDTDDTERPSGWQRAAIWEAVGRRNFTSADDIDAAPPVFS